MRLKVLDLFSGLGGFSQAFRDRGHEVVTVDIDPRFSPTICADIMDLSADDLPDDVDVILASPPCNVFSVALFWKHYWKGRGVPATEEAVNAIDLVEHTLHLIEEVGPRWWWLENPRGMLRHVPVMKKYPRVTVTYCQYGARWMKPTDLWGRWPPTWKPRPMCHPGDPCHEAAPRGTKTAGIQGIRDPAERAKVPYELSKEICVACENSFDEEMI